MLLVGASFVAACKLSACSAGAASPIVLAPSFEDFASGVSFFQLLTNIWLPLQWTRYRVQGPCIARWTSGSHVLV
jgi:hypothetical protein